VYKEGGDERAQGGECKMTNGMPKGQGGECKMTNGMPKGQGGECKMTNGMPKGQGGECKMTNGMPKGQGGECKMTNGMPKGQGEWNAKRARRIAKGGKRRSWGWNKESELRPDQNIRLNFARYFKGSATKKGRGRKWQRRKSGEGGKDRAVEGIRRTTQVCKKCEKKGKAMRGKECDGAKRVQERNGKEKSVNVQ
jgi:hypothetical protein